MNLWTIYGRLTAGHCALNQRTAECGGSMPATAKSNQLAAYRLWRKLKSARCSHHQSLHNCSTRLHSLPVSAIAVCVADIYINIYIYVAMSRMEHNHWPRFTHGCCSAINLYCIMWLHQTYSLLKRWGAFVHLGRGHMFTSRAKLKHCTTIWLQSFWFLFA